MKKIILSYTYGFSFLHFFLQLYYVCLGFSEERLQSFEAEKKVLQEEVKKLKQKLEDEKEKSLLAEKYSTPRVQPRSNGPDMQVVEAQSK